MCHKTVSQMFMQAELCVYPVHHWTYIQLNCCQELFSSPVSSPSLLSSPFILAVSAGMRKQECQNVNGSHLVSVSTFSSLLTPQMLSPVIRFRLDPGLAEHCLSSIRSCLYTWCMHVYTHTESRYMHSSAFLRLCHTAGSLTKQKPFLIFFPQAWLRKFGYLSQASRQMSTMQSAQILSKAISDMQRFYGLQVTGEMDPATVM